jgi:signal peptidase I
VIALRFPIDPKQIFLKRVVGMPGDRIKMMNKELLINGKKVIEPYVVHTTDYFDSYRDNFPAEPNVTLEAGAIKMLHSNVQSGEVVVPPGNYFVMGDNRDASLDGRYWGFLGNADLLGRPVLVLGNGKREYLRYPLGG